LFYGSDSTFPVTSIPIARSTLKQRQAPQGDRIGVNALIRWEGLGNRRRRGGGLMASRNPALPLDSHVPSHAKFSKINRVNSRAPLIARAIAGGRTRTRRPPEPPAVIGNRNRHGTAFNLAAQFAIGRQPARVHDVSAARARCLVSKSRCDRRIARAHLMPAAPCARLP
jgi:hypothetical protein